SKGLRGHLGALRRGRLTTGALKAAGIPLLALAGAAASPAPRGGAMVLADAALTAGCANLAHLLDLRPGRALKDILPAAATLAGRRAPGSACGRRERARRHRNASGPGRAAARTGRPPTGPARAWHARRCRGQCAGSRRGHRRRPLHRTSRTAGHAGPGRRAEPRQRDRELQHRHRAHPRAPRPGPARPPAPPGTGPRPHPRRDPMSPTPPSTPGGSTTARAIVRGAGLILVITAIARIAGFVRYLVFGASVGAGDVGTAYSTANLLPNVLFEVVAGGA